MDEGETVFTKSVIGNKTLDVRVTNTQARREGREGGAGADLPFSPRKNHPLTWGKMSALFPGTLPGLSGSFLAGLLISPETSVPPGCSEHP